MRGQQEILKAERQCPRSYRIVPREGFTRNLKSEAPVPEELQHQVPVSLQDSPARARSYRTTCLVPRAPKVQKVPKV